MAENGIRGVLHFSLFLTLFLFVSFLLPLSFSSSLLVFSLSLIDVSSLYVIWIKNAWIPSTHILFSYLPRHIHVHKICIHIESHRNRIWDASKWERCIILRNNSPWNERTHEQFLIPMKKKTRSKLPFHYGCDESITENLKCENSICFEYSIEMSSPAEEAYELRDTHTHTHKNHE